MMNKLGVYPVIAFVIALILGFAFVMFYPQFELSIDAIEYDTLGWNLSQGNGYTMKDGVADATKEPFYPLLLSLIYSIFGRNHQAVRLVQVVINALSCLIIYFIGRETVGRRAAAISSLIAAIYPAFIAYSGYILAETLFTFLLAISILVLIKAMRRRSYLRYAMLGFILGIAMLCKAVLIAFPIFISLVLLVFTKLNKRTIGYVFCMILVVLITILPWAVRNYKVFDSIIPTRIGGGLTLWVGSYLPWNGESMGGRGGYPEGRVEFLKTEPLASLVKGCSQLEADKILMREALKNIKDNPLGYIRISLKRVLKLWMHPIGEERIRARNIFLSKILNAFHYIVLSFSLIGIVFSIRNLDMSLPMISIILYFTLIHSMTYASPRYHFPVIPYVLLFAGSGFLYLMGFIVDQTLGVKAR